MECLGSVCASEIGLLEVDRIAQAWKFGAKTANLLIRTTPQPPPSPPPPKDNTTEDRISELPNGILHFIISLLTMREGAASSILSTRWRNLWSTSVSVLNCDATNMIGYDYPRNTPSSYQLNARFNFIRRVNQVLQLCPVFKMEALRVSFDLDTESTSDINQWLKYAINQGVTELELDFDYRHCYYWSYLARRSFEFPFQSFASCLKYLHLDTCVFNFPPDFNGFSSLISLTLKHVCLPKGSVQNILSNCSALEWLGLLECIYIGCSTNLEVSGLSLPLKHLRIDMATCDYVPKIEVHNVNIMSFEFTGFSERLSIQNAPRLERLLLCTLTPVILSNVPCLETLFLTAYARAKESILPKVFEFNNLKRLVFLSNGQRTNLLEVINLFEACPFLQKLEVDMGISDEKGNVETETRKQIATRSRSPHTNLKEIELYGVQCHLEKLELIKYFLRCAIVPKNIKLCTTTKMYLGDGKWILKELQSKQEYH